MSDIPRLPYEQLYEDFGLDRAKPEDGLAISKDSKAISFDQSAKTFKIDTEKAGELLALFKNAREAIDKEDNEDKRHEKLEKLDALRKRLDPIIDATILANDEEISKTPRTKKSISTKVDDTEIELQKEEAKLKSLEKKWSFGKKKAIKEAQEKIKVLQTALKEVKEKQVKELKPRQDNVRLNWLKEQLSKAVPLPKGYVPKAERQATVGQSKTSASDVAHTVLGTGITREPEKERETGKAAVSSTVEKAKDTKKSDQLAQLSELAQALAEKRGEINDKLRSKDDPFSLQFLDNRNWLLEQLQKQVGRLQERAKSGQDVGHAISKIDVEAISIDIPPELAQISKKLAEGQAQLKKIAQALVGVPAKLKPTEPKVTAGLMLQYAQLTKQNRTLSSAFDDISYRFKRLGQTVENEGIENISSSASRCLERANALLKEANTLSQLAALEKFKVELAQKKNEHKKVQPSQNALECERIFHTARGKVLDGLEKQIFSWEARIKAGQDVVKEFPKIESLAVTLEFGLSSRMQSAESAHGLLEKDFNLLKELHGKNPLFLAQQSLLEEARASLKAKDFPKQINEVTQRLASSQDDNYEDLEKLIGQYRSEVNALDAKIKHLELSLNFDSYKKNLANKKDDEMEPGVPRPDTLFLNTVSSRLQHAIQTTQKHLEAHKLDRDDPSFQTLYLASEWILSELRTEEFYSLFFVVVDYGQKLAACEAMFTKLTEAERGNFSAELEKFRALKPNVEKVQQKVANLLDDPCWKDEKPFERFWKDFEGLATPLADANINDFLSRLLKAKNIP